MSYQKVWKAKGCVLEDLMGSVEESYAKLARYCHNTEKTNHDSAFFIEMEAENCFKFFFMPLGQCIQEFQNAMRPLILVDGTNLKSKYQVDNENNLSMRWFFTKLREVIGKVEDLAFVTDRGQSIINGIAEVFPCAHHGYCMYYIQGNLKTRYRGKGIISHYRRAIEAYRIEECNRYMIEIESKSFSAWDYLTKMGIEHWACSYFLGRQYNMITSNNAESLNLESFSCEHAVAVAMYRGFAARTLCSPYYTAENWRAAYVEIIFPLPNEAE
ncbi:uncharacterized protein LOC111406670 [Olea europaea var. sylvestris]|uniref:uncharacterized protein LOC111406670 n=1 Tax=Olea europaea var. sylvestris TaxID=158386 RepID=UPI000C1D495A|nr:uncharacterized protein LOC111406670 [Olea europaea var. sylvestris]